MPFLPQRRAGASVCRRRKMPIRGLARLWGARVLGSRPSLPCRKTSRQPARCPAPGCPGWGVGVAMRGPPLTRSRYADFARRRSWRGRYGLPSPDWFAVELVPRLGTGQRLMPVAISMATRLASTEQVVSNDARIVPRWPFAFASAKPKKRYQSCRLCFTGRIFHCGSARDVVG